MSLSNIARRMLDKLKFITDFKLVDDSQQDDISSLVSEAQDIVPKTPGRPPHERREQIIRMRMKGTSLKQVIERFPDINERTAMHAFAHYNKNWTAYWLSCTLELLVHHNLPPLVDKTIIRVGDKKHGATIEFDKSCYRCVIDKYREPDSFVLVTINPVTLQPVSEAIRDVSAFMRGEPNAKHSPASKRFGH